MLLAALLIKATVYSPVSWRQQHQFSLEPPWQPYLALFCINTGFPIEFAQKYNSSVGALLCKVKIGHRTFIVYVLSSQRKYSVPYNKMTVKTLLSLLFLCVLVAQFSEALVTSDGKLRNTEHGFLATRLMCLKSNIHISILLLQIHTVSISCQRRASLREFSSSVLYLCQGKFCVFNPSTN